MASEEPPPVPPSLRRADPDTGEVIRYSMGEKLGSGGFGVVYAGEELPSHDPVAIKCIPKTRIADKRVKQKLLSEVRIQKSLNHPNIVGFKGVFQDQNYVYILLEICTGGTVLDMLKKKHPMDEETTAHLMKQLLEALTYLHSQRVIHRDLKLQNFLLDSNGVMKVADFGLSAQLVDPDEKKMTVCGTPSYLSPEVLAGREGQTVLVDIWAVGVCAFLLLTGHQPFQATDKKITYQKIKQVQYTWPETPEISENAKHFVDSALQRDPTKRPTAFDLLSHPFITRQEGPPLPAMPPAPPPIQMPSFAVRIWWDVSSRYGLTYLLHNHISGACFNDRSRILLTPDEGIAQYWATPQTPRPEIISMRAVEDSPIRKKLILMKHFASTLKERAGELPQPPLRINLPSDVIPHVKYWARTKDGVMFRMACKDIQANFKDHTRLVIESATKTLYFDTGNGVEIMTLADLKDKTQHPDARKRFCIVKEMAKFLV